MAQASETILHIHVSLNEAQTRPFVVSVSNAELARSESSDLEFALPFSLPQQQTLKISVDSVSTDLSVAKLLSSTADGVHLPLALPDAPNMQAHARIVSIQGPTQSSQVELKFSATNVAKMDVLSESDPFVTILHNGNKVYSSHHFDNEPNPVWPAFTMPLVELCQNNLDSPLSIQLFDFNELSGLSPLSLSLPLPSILSTLTRTPMQSTR